MRRYSDIFGSLDYVSAQEIFIIIENTFRGDTLLLMSVI